MPHKSAFVLCFYVMLTVTLYKTEEINCLVCFSVVVSAVQTGNFVNDIWGECSISLSQIRCSIGKKGANTIG